VHRRVYRRMVGDDLNSVCLGRANGPLEEAAGSPPVTLGGDKDIHDLAELVDGAEHGAPPAGDRHVGLIHLPAVPDGVPAGPGGLGQQRGEPLVGCRYSDRAHELVGSHRPRLATVAPPLHPPRGPGPVVTGLLVLVLVVHRHDRHLHPCLLGVQENRERWTPWCATTCLRADQGPVDLPYT
jgi:hypothetical protein